MTNFEILDEIQAEFLAGGRGSDFSYVNATTDISNFVIQENHASNWASAVGLPGSSSTMRRGKGGGSGGGVEAETGAIIQGNLNYFTPFALTLALG